MGKKIRTPRLWCKIVLFCVSLTIYLSAQATIDESQIEITLHVDANHTNGSDSNEGTSQSQPLKTIQAAVDKAKGIATRIILADGDYRHYVDIGSDEHLLIIEAANSGKARITGSDLAGGVRNVNGSIYAIHWPYDWGMGNTVFKGYKAGSWRARRKEMVFIDGKRLDQRMKVENNGDVIEPIAVNELESGEFTVDEDRDSIFFKPPAGVSINDETVVEMSVRGTAERGYGNNSGILMDIIDHPNLVLRGLVFQHSANHIKSDPAVRIKSTSSGGNDRRDLSKNILIENCTFRNNKSSGFKMQNSRNVTIRECKFEENGINGVSTNCLENVLWESCSFSGNNWAGGDWMAGHHGAGMKMLSGQLEDGWFPALTDGVLFRKCVFRNNHCPGFWQDYGGKNVTLEQCLIENNTNRGVDNEMTFGTFTLKNCVIRNNGVCNVQWYGSSNTTIDGCVIYDATTGGKTTELRYVANFRIIADDRKNSGHPADIRFHTIVNSVIVASKPQTNNYRIYKYGSAELETFGKLPYINTLTSDYNRWYRRDQESFPWPYAFIGTRTFPNEGWKEAWPDMTWDEYRALTPESGRKLDEHSVWGDVDLEKVADSVLNLTPFSTTKTAILKSQCPELGISITGNRLRIRNTIQVVSLMITDAQGRLLLKKKGTFSNSKVFTLPALSSQMLIVHLTTNTGHRSSHRLLLR